MDSVKLKLPPVCAVTSFPRSDGGIFIDASAHPVGISAFQIAEEHLLGIWVKACTGKKFLPGFVLQGGICLGGFPVQGAGPILGIALLVLIAGLAFYMARRMITVAALLKRR